MEGGAQFHVSTKTVFENLDIQQATASSSASVFKINASDSLPKLTIWNTDFSGHDREQLLQIDGDAQIIIQNSTFKRSKFSKAMIHSNPNEIYKNQTSNQFPIQNQMVMIDSALEDIDGPILSLNSFKGPVEIVRNQILRNNGDVLMSINDLEATHVAFIENTFENNTGVLEIKAKSMRFAVSFQGNAFTNNKIRMENVDTLKFSENTIDKTPIQITAGLLSGDRYEQLIKSGKDLTYMHKYALNKKEVVEIGKLTIRLTNFQESALQVTGIPGVFMTDCNFRNVEISIKDSEAAQINESRFTQHSKVTFSEGNRLELQNSTFSDYGSVLGSIISMDGHDQVLGLKNCAFRDVTQWASPFEDGASLISVVSGHITASDNTFTDMTVDKLIQVPNSRDSEVRHHKDQHSVFATNQFRGVVARDQLFSLNQSAVLLQHNTYDQVEGPQMLYALSSLIVSKNESLQGSKALYLKGEDTLVNIQDALFKESAGPLIDVYESGVQVKNTSFVGGKEKESADGKAMIVMRGEFASSWSGHALIGGQFNGSIFDNCQFIDLDVFSLVKLKNSNLKIAGSNISSLKTQADAYDLHKNSNLTVQYSNITNFRSTHNLFKISQAATLNFEDGTIVGSQVVEEDLIQVYGSFNLKRSVIQSNGMSADYYLVKSTQGDIKMEQVTMKHNHNLFLLLFSKIQLHHTVIYQNTGDGFSSYKSELTLQNVTATEQNNGKNVGLFDLDGSVLKIRKSTFENITGEAAGLMYSTGKSYVEIADTNVLNFPNERNSAAPLIVLSFVPGVLIDNVNFTDIFHTTLDLNLIANVTIRDSTFSYSTASNGQRSYMAIYDSNVTLVNNTLQNCKNTIFKGVGIWAAESSLTIQDSVFRNLTSRKGGALYLDKMKAATIKDSIFENNAATGDGGAIQVRQIDQMQITGKSVFRDNVAGRTGGALLYDCFESPSKRCDLKIGEDVVFKGNEAGVEGGAIQVAHESPKYEGNFLKLNQNNDNRACARFGCSYGQFIGTQPHKLLVYVMDQESNSFVAIDPGHGAVLVPSGTPTQIRVKTLDERGALIDSNNRTQMTIQPEDINTSSIKNGQAHCQKGICDFDELVITLEPGREGTLILRSDSYYLEPFYLKVESQKCNPGESFTEDNECLPCPEGKYLLDAAREQQVCKDCPVDAFCWGGNKMAPREFYYRRGDEFAECLNREACVQPKHGQVVENGLCKEGHKGVMCAQCQPDYTSGVNHVCSECGTNQEEMRKSFLKFLWLFAIILVLTALNVRNASVKRHTLTMYIKILMDFIKTFRFASSFDYQFSPVIGQVMKIQQWLLVDTFSDTIVSFRCVLLRMSQAGNGTSEHWYRLIASCVLPLVMILLCFIVHFVMSLIDNKELNRPMRLQVTRRTICSICVTTWVFYSEITNLVFASFGCRKMFQEDEKSMFLADPGVTCWEGDHLFYATRIALPVLIFFCIGWPYLLFKILTQSYHDISKLLGDGDLSRYDQQQIDYKKITYGFHFIGYKDQAKPLRHIKIRQEQEEARVEAEDPLLQVQAIRKQILQTANLSDKKGLKPSKQSSFHVLKARAKQRVEDRKQQAGIEKKFEKLQTGRDRAFEKLPDAAKARYKEESAKRSLVVKYNQDCEEELRALFDECDQNATGFLGREQFKEYQRKVEVLNAQKFGEAVEQADSEIDQWFDALDMISPENPAKITHEDLLKAEALLKNIRLRKLLQPSIKSSLAEGLRRKFKKVEYYKIDVCQYWDVLIYCQQFLMILFGALCYQLSAEAQAFFIILLVTENMLLTYYFRPYQNKIINDLANVSLVLNVAFIYFGFFYIANQHYDLIPEGSPIDVLFVALISFCLLGFDFLWSLKLLQEILYQILRRKEAAFGVVTLGRVDPHKFKVGYLRDNKLELQLQYEEESDEASYLEKSQVRQETLLPGVPIPFSDVKGPKQLQILGFKRDPKFIREQYELFDKINSAYEGGSKPMTAFKKGLRHSRDLRDTTMKLQSKEIRLFTAIIKAERNRMRRFSAVEDEIVEDTFSSLSDVHADHLACDSDPDWASPAKFESRDSNMTQNTNCLDNSKIDLIPQVLERDEEILPKHKWMSQSKERWQPPQAIQFKSLWKPEDKALALPLSGKRQARNQFEIAKGAHDIFKYNSRHYKPHIVHKEDDIESKGPINLEMAQVVLKKERSKSKIKKKNDETRTIKPPENNQNQLLQKMEELKQDDQNEGTFDFGFVNTKGVVSSSVVQYAFDPTMMRVQTDESKETFTYSDSVINSTFNTRNERSTNVETQQNQSMVQNGLSQPRRPANVPALNMYIVEQCNQEYDDEIGQDNSQSESNY